MYLDQFRALALNHIAELNADLVNARQALERSRSQTAQLERNVHSIQTLVALAESDANSMPSVSPEMTLHDAMAEVLRNSPETQYMMRPREIAVEITRRNLYRMGDGRPVETQQIHARVGHYKNIFERVGTFIRLINP